VDLINNDKFNKMNERFTEVKKFLLEFEDKGLKKSENGTLLIGNIPQINSYAYVHHIYPPLSKFDIESIEKELTYPIPEIYKQFLLECCNGFSCFFKSLTMFGYRSSTNRSLESMYQPLSIIVENTYSSPDNSTNNDFFIGFLDSGHCIFIKKNTGKIYKCDKNDALKIQDEWDNLFDFLISEIKRLSVEYIYPSI